MSSEWQSVSLDSLIEPHRSISYGIVQPGSPVADGIPVIRVADVRHGRIDVSAPLRVSPSVEAAHSRTRLVGGELLLTLVGTVGQAAIAPRSLAGWNTARAVAVIPVREEVGAYWVKLALEAPAVRDLIHARLNTTVQATLNLGDVAQLPIVLPPAQDRETIVGILGALDDKIDLNRRMSETLEAMARALFTSWFVDFDPVRAKAEGRDPGLPPHLGQLFPDSFEGSELGEIPAGWQIGPFGQLAELLREQENPFASPDEVFDHFSLPAFDAGQTPKREKGSEILSQKFRVPTGVVLLSKLNPEIDRVWLVDVGLHDRGVCSTEFLVLRPKPSFTRSYVYCFARSSMFRQQMTGMVTGTSKSHQRATPDSIFRVSAVLPSSAAVAAFDSQAESMLRRALEARSESRTLAALRDTLLPKLISGELRVPAAEQLVTAALS